MAPRTGTAVNGEPLNLDAHGVRRSDHDTLLKSIRTHSNIITSSVNIQDGVLTFDIHVGTLAGNKLENFVKKINASVLGIVNHKANVPGDGKKRRTPSPEKPRFVHNPQLVR